MDARHFLLLGVLIALSSCGRVAEPAFTAPPGVVSPPLRPPEMRSIRGSLSPAIEMATTLDSPEGLYAFTIESADPQLTTESHSFLVQACSRPASRARTSTSRMCRIIWRRTYAPGLEPSVDTFEVTFRRATSTLERDDGKPIYDHWHAQLDYVYAHYRMFISEDRATMQWWAEEHAEMHVWEAPIARRTSEGQQVP